MATRGTNPRGILLSFAPCLLARRWRRRGRDNQLFDGTARVSAALAAIVPVPAMNLHPLRSPPAPQMLERNHGLDRGQLQIGTGKHAQLRPLATEIFRENEGLAPRSGSCGNDPNAHRSLRGPLIRPKPFSPR
jgi:hypothetical protein